MNPIYRSGLLAGAVSALLLSACGGGGGGADGELSVQEAFAQRTAKSEPLRQICAEPRATDTAGLLADERDWLATYMDEVYLWFDEIPNRNASSYTAATYGGNREAMQAYFDDLLTEATTGSGAAKDQFSFTFDTAEYSALAQSGIQLSYGFQADLISRSPPREIVIAYTNPNTPASAESISRGARIEAIDGEPVVDGDSAVLNAGLFPDEDDRTHTFTIRDRGAATTRDVTLTARQITLDPVQNVKTITTNTGLVGYFLFNDFIATAEGELYRAIRDLAAAGISDLVLDMRYNGGGFLDISGELGYQVAGPAATNGRVFEILRFNRKNPLGRTPDLATPFHRTTQGFDGSVANGTRLSSLDLPRVFVLTGPGTCSASESLINGLQGIDVEVIRIGDTTCGKPFGFFQWDNCGLSYFAIEFEGVNDKGEGGFSDGIAPTCDVADDYDNDLGDPAEARLAAALNYRDTGSCPVVAKRNADVEVIPLRSVLRENAYRRLPLELQQ